MNLNKVICPISENKIDSNISRITTFLNVILLIAFLYSQSFVLITIISIDYFIRACLPSKISPAKLLATQLSKSFKLNKKPINEAPKVFAARLGFICSFLGGLFLVINLPLASLIITLILTVLAIFDSVFNFCVGCTIYHYVVFPFYKKRMV